LKKQKQSFLDQALLKRQLKTDRRVQTEVYTTYYKRVYTSCLRILNDVHEAEDLMQEAFIHAFKKCLDHLKKRRVDLKFDEDWERKSSDSFDPNEDTSYDVERIQNAMTQLPDGCRIVFHLYMFEEMDHESIAVKLGIKEASSRAQYARAKNKIKELISEAHV